MKLLRTYFSFAFVALFMGIAFGVSEGQVGTPITPKVVQINFANREMQAHLQIRTFLQNLRQEISTRRLSFQVGYTTALDFKIAQITGAVVPEFRPVGPAAECCSPPDFEGIASTDACSGMFPQHSQL